MVKHLIALTGCAFIAGCAATTSGNMPPNLSSQSPQTLTRSLMPNAAGGHAYVTTIEGWNGNNFVPGLIRFPIVNGKLGSTPDLTYSATGPIALAPDGSLYAVDASNYLQLDHFPAGSTTPDSELMVQPCGSSFLYGGITALTVDAQGYIYTAIDEESSGARGSLGRGKLHARDTGCSSETVVIYPPGATANTAPVQFVDFDQFYGEPTFGIGLNPRGELAITRISYNDIRYYAKPLQNPRFNGFVASASLHQPEGITFNGKPSEVYVVNHDPSSVSVLPGKIVGDLKALRIIEVADKVHPNGRLCGELAVNSTSIFVTDSVVNTLYQLKKNARGRVTPTASATVNFPACGVVLGP